MTATITWIINALDCAPSEDGKTNVVKTVHWACSGVDSGHSGNAYSTCSLPSPVGEFVEYASLTKAKVLGWIWANGVDQAATEASILQQINTSKNPPIVQPKLPWLS